jgi:archaellum biogenesis protein FlaJ (TadC family)
MTRRDARIQKWAIIAFAIVEAVIIALVVMTRIRGG